MRFFLLYHNLLAFYVPFNNNTERCCWNGTIDGASDERRRRSNGGGRVRVKHYLSDYSACGIPARLSV